VSSHIQRIFVKLDVHTRAQAVAVAYEAGLIRLASNGNGTVSSGQEVEAHTLATAAAED
jgi:hypothetical protein